MAKHYNLARMTTATTGTGTITLGAAVTGFRTFADAGVQNGDLVSYGIIDGDHTEVGRGVYTASGTTLTRSVLSSTTGAALNLSGDAEVYITVLAEDLHPAGIWNAKDYGVVGNGTTDDTSHLQDLMDEATETGGEIWLPPGTYSHGPLTVYRNLILRGAGRRTTTLKARAAGTMLDYGSDPGFGFMAGELRDLTLDGNNTGTTALSMIGGFKVRLARVEAVKFTGTAVYLRRVLIGHWDDVILSENNIGIDADSGVSDLYGGIQANLMSFRSCTISNHAEWAVKWANGEKVLFEHCNFENNGSHPNNNTGTIHYTPETTGQGISFDHCWFEHNYGLAELVIAAPQSAGQVSTLTDCAFVKTGATPYTVYVAGSGGANKLISRNSTFYQNAVTADFYADGSAATIYMDHSGGTMGGSGTFVISGTDLDEKAKVSANDTTAGYLNGKLVAGANITITENNNGGNETLTITATAAPSSGGGYAAVMDNTGNFIYDNSGRPLHAD